MLGQDSWQHGSVILVPRGKTTEARVSGNGASRAKVFDILVPGAGSCAVCCVLGQDSWQHGSVILVPRGKTTEARVSGNGASRAKVF